VLLQSGVRGTEGHVTHGVSVQHLQPDRGMLLPDDAAASIQSSRADHSRSAVSSQALYSWMHAPSPRPRGQFQ